MATTESPALTEKQIARFWAKVKKSDVSDGCWTWEGATMNGYGLFWVRPKPQRAHRVSFLLANGHYPAPDLVCCHNCGNRMCVRPDHLRADTHLANMADKVAHGTAPIGVNNPRSKLTEEQVLAIFRDPRKLLREIAADYGVKLQTVHHIRTGRRWGHLTSKELVAPE